MKPTLLADSIPLLRTKLYVPAPRPNLVPRARLIARLNEGVRLGHHLTLVSAPAGSGKTILLATWAHSSSAPSAQIAWLSLDADDNDPTRFLVYLIAAIEQQQPDIGTNVHALRQVPHPPAIKTLLTILINALTSIPDDLILILDDYHLIEQTPIHEAVAFLLERLPPNLHLVIATRVDPPLPLPRLRARSQLTEIRAADLRFTLDEATTFLNQVMQLDLQPADIAALEARTEGWIASLQLAALSLRGKSTIHPANDIATFIDGFSGSHRHVIDYLAAEVLAQQSAGIRAFLRQTAILDRLTAPLCDAVTGRDDSNSILRHLEQANLFLIPLDNDRHWYRYHHLFADFLRAHLHRDMPDQVQDLHHRAAAWYEQQAMWPEAIGHTLKAQDFAAAIRLIQHVALDILKRSEATTLIHWIQALPDAKVRENPDMCLYYTEAMLITGHYELAESYLQSAEKGLETTDAIEARRSILSQVAAIRAYIATYQGQIHQGVELAQQAYDYLPEDNAFLRSFATWLLGFSQFFDTDIVAAQRIFNETLELSQATGNTLISALSIFITGNLYILQGHLHQARAFFERGLTLFEAASWSTETETSPSASLVYQGLGEVLREMNELEVAEQHMIRCIALAEQWSNAEILVDSYVVLARIHQGRGDFTAAQQTLDLAMTFVHEGKVSPLTTRQIESHQARLWIAAGNLEAAVRWGESWATMYAAQPLNGNIALFVNWMETSALARLDIALGRYTAALERVIPLREAMLKLGWTGIVIELLALESLARYRQGQMRAALTPLRRAFTLAEPEGYVRVFLDAGEGIESLLKVARENDIMADYAERLLQVESHKLRAKGVEKANFQLTEALSLREFDVLRLIADGLTNQEIADALYIAISTVKTHINNIYGKLEVTNRVQALARARELGILN